MQTTCVVKARGSSLYQELGGVARISRERGSGQFLQAVGPRRTENVSVVAKHRRSWRRRGGRFRSADRLLKAMQARTSRMEVLELVRNRIAVPSRVLLPAGAMVAGDGEGPGSG
jgi:hypothetical protein